MNLLQITALMFFVSGSVNQELAEAIHDHCREEVREVATLIAFKESSYKFNMCTENGDCGLWQINDVHDISAADRLDVDASTRFACALLEDHFEYKDEDRMWFARYHSKTPSLKEAYYKQIWELAAHGRR